MCTPVSGLYDQSLPTKIAILLSKLPQSTRNADRICVHANKDAVAISKRVQKRKGTNSICQKKPTAQLPSADFICCTPHADRDCLIIRKLIEQNRNFAAYFPTSLLNEISKDVTGGEHSTSVQHAVDTATKIVFSSINACWLIHLPDHTQSATSNRGPTQHS